MAVTIKAYPQQLAPVYNPIVFTVSSTNSYLCNFNYICDVYINGVYVKRLKRFPAGTNDYADFNVSRVLEDSLTWDLKENLYGTTLFSKSTNSILTYLLKFGEEYDNSAQCASGTTIYPDLTLSSSITIFQAFNGAISKKDWLTFVYTDYYASTATSKFLTKTPNEVLINYGDQMVYNIFTTSNEVDYLQVKTYNVSGTLLGTYVYKNTNTSTDITVLSVGVGPENLNNSTLFSGTQPVITSVVSYYTVTLFNNVGANYSETKTITIDKRDLKWTPHRLWWLNRLGGFDSYTYTLKDKRKIDVGRTEYKQLYGDYRYISPGGTWDYENKERGRKTLSVSAQEGQTFESNYLTELEALWMEELFTTLELYEIETNGKLCFGSIDVQPNGDVLIAGVGEIAVEGDEVIIVFDEPEVYGNGGVFVVGSGEVIGNPFGSGIPSPVGVMAATGYVLPLGFVSELEPLIIKTSGWEEKVKSKIKNINYIIDVDKAESVNTQRN